MLLFAALQILCFCGLFAFVSLQGKHSNPYVVLLLLVLSSIFLLGNYSLLTYSVPADLGAEVAATAAGIATMVSYLASGGL